MEHRLRDASPHWVVCWFVEQTFYELCGFLPPSDWDLLFTWCSAQAANRWRVKQWVPNILKDNLKLLQVNLEKLTGDSRSQLYRADPQLKSSKIQTQPNGLLFLAHRDTSWAPAGPNSFSPYRKQLASSTLLPQLPSQSGFQSYSLNNLDHISRFIPPVCIVASQCQRGLVSGPQRLEKSMDADVAYVKWHK